MIEEAIYYFICVCWLLLAMHAMIINLTCTYHSELSVQRRGENRIRSLFVGDVITLKYSIVPPYVLFIIAVERVDTYGTTLEESV